MKKLCIVILITCISASLHAQQKPSERSFAEEARKVQEKKANRNLLVSRQPDAAPQPAATTPVMPAPADKPSLRPMKKPSRPNRQQ